MLWFNRKKREQEQRLAEEENRRRLLEERTKEQNRMEAYHTFDPMVRRLLEELRQTVWGEGYSISSPYIYRNSWHLEKETYRTSEIRYTRNYYVELLFDGVEPRKFSVRCRDYKEIYTDDVQEESLRRALSRAHYEGPHIYTHTGHFG